MAVVSSRPSGLNATETELVPVGVVATGVSAPPVVTVYTDTSPVAALAVASNVPSGLNFTVCGP